MKQYKGYEFKYDKILNDVGIVGEVYEHKKTKATVVLLKNDDDNKVFTIGFKTPPENSTGVAHILEHSVLSGSKNYPIKDPFVELLKSSLNTFLNAMTYPDRTLYPCASVNDKDFKNIMGIYLDSVFFPMIYDQKEIFLQEGWHHHLEDRNDDITYNGIVYNEMKGVFSSVESIAYEEIYKRILKDTQYGVCSGGDPDHIPELSYEEFLDFHKTYYHPSNSFIVLYGDMDYEERMKYIDEEYLSKFEYRDIKADIKFQAPYDEISKEVVDYSVSKEENVENKTGYAYATIVEKNDDVKLMMSMNILMYALVNHTGSAVKKHLMARGLGEDISADMEDDMNQAVFTITAFNAKNDAKDEFLSELESVIKEEIEKGLDKKTLLSAINQQEFSFKEADYGTFSKGLYYMLYVFKSVIYDKDKAFLYLEKNKIFDELKTLVDTDYFENLAKKYLLDSKNKLLLELRPVKGLSDSKDALLKEKLAKYKESLSDDEIDELINQTRSLIKYQETPNSKEVLKKLPTLKREDLSEDVKEFRNEIDEDGILSVYNDYNTNGIAYMKLEFFFDIAKIDLPLLGIISKLLMKVDTKNYKYRDILNEVHINTGGMSFHINSLEDLQGNLKARFSVEAKSLSNKVSKTVSYMEELLNHTLFDDVDRIKEILIEQKVRLEENLKSSGHKAGSIRSSSNINKLNYLLDNISGIGYLEYISELLADFENKKLDLNKKLRATLDSVLKANRAIINFTGAREDFIVYKKNVVEFVSKYDDNTEEIRNDIKLKGSVKEAFKVSSLVQYVSKSTDFKSLGLDYYGYLSVVKTIVNYEYIWEKIRIKGGAYGGGFYISNNGMIKFTSYRDPNLDETNKVYDELKCWLESFDEDEEFIFKYIIGTIGSLDAPLSVSQLGERSYNAYLSLETRERQLRLRKELLNTTSEDIRNSSKYLGNMDDASLCVIGGEEKIDKSGIKFDKVRKL